MIRKLLIVSLMAIMLLINIVTAQGITASLSGNSLTCSEVLDLTGQGNLDYEMYITDSGGNVIGDITKGNTNTEVGSITVYTNTGLPTCNSIYYCNFKVSDGSFDNKQILYQCSTTVTIPGMFGNITITNQSNISQNNYGTLPFNATGNVTATTILGLNKDDFFKVAALIILTIIAVSIKPKQIAIIALFIGINLFTDILGIFTLPVTLIVLIMFLLLLELLKGRHY